jgi:hypothetical protein
MQIGSSTSLTYIAGSKPSAQLRPQGNVAGADALAVDAQSQPSATATLASSKELVYSMARKPAASPANASSPSVDQNGVLLAVPASAAEVKARAFVHQAVNTMRAYADEQERQKNLVARFTLFA